ncbi:hypothetical protein N2152v2_002263 [Parachlorella kessleri]
MGQSDEPSLGLLLHELLHCTKAQEQRLFLAKDTDTRNLFFCALERSQAFTPGLLAGEQQPSAATFAQLFALLISRICSSGAGALARAQLQLAVLEHVRQHSRAYVRLLGPHSHCGLTVQAALHTLLGCIPTDQDILVDDVRLLSASDRGARGTMRHACDRLCFVAEFLSQAWRAAADSGQQLSSELLSAGLASLFNGIAMIERAVREEVEGEFSNLGKNPASKPASAEVEKRVRKQLPQDTIRKALLVTTLLPPSALQSFFELASQHDEPVLILLLRLELLWERLPEKKRGGLHVLPLLLQPAERAGVQMAIEIRQQVEATFADQPGSIRTGRLRDLLSILRAVLRASDRAAALGLLKPKQVQQRTIEFASAVLFDLSTSCSEAEPSAAGGKEPVFWLLWHLLASQAGHGSATLSTNALCKASNVLSWVFSSSQTAVAQHLASHVATSGLLERILASTATPVLQNPFCREVCRAILGVWSTLKDLPAWPAPVAERLLQFEQLDRPHRTWHARWTAGSALAVAAAGAEGQHPGVKDLDAADGLLPTSGSGGGSSSSSSSAAVDKSAVLPPHKAAPGSTRSASSSNKTATAAQDRALSSSLASCTSSASDGSDAAGKGASTKQPGPGNPAGKPTGARELQLLKEQLAKRQSAKRQAANQQQQEQQQEENGMVAPRPGPDSPKPLQQQALTGPPERDCLPAVPQEQRPQQPSTPVQAPPCRQKATLNPHAPQYTPQQLQQSAEYQIAPKPGVMPVSPRPSLPLPERRQQQQQQQQQVVEQPLGEDPCSLPNSCTQKQGRPLASPSESAIQLHSDECPSLAPSLYSDGTSRRPWAQPTSDTSGQPCQQESPDIPESSGTPGGDLCTHKAEVAFTGAPSPPTPLKGFAATVEAHISSPAGLPSHPSLSCQSQPGHDDGGSLSAGSGSSTNASSSSSGSCSSVETGRQDPPGLASRAAVADVTAGLSQLSIDSPAGSHTPPQPQLSMHQHCCPHPAPPPQAVPAPPLQWREMPPHVPQHAIRPPQQQPQLQSMAEHGAVGAVGSTPTTAAESQGSSGLYYDSTINALQCRSAQPGAASPTSHGWPSNTASSSSHHGWLMGSASPAVQPAHVAYTAAPRPSHPATSIAHREQQAAGAAPMPTYPSLQGQLQPGNPVGNWGNYGGSGSGSGSSGGGGGGGCGSGSNMDIDGSTTAMPDNRDAMDGVTTWPYQASFNSPAELDAPTQPQPPACHRYPAAWLPFQAVPVPPANWWELPLNEFFVQLPLEVRCWLLHRVAQREQHLAPDVAFYAFQSDIQQVRQQLLAQAQQQLVWEAAAAPYTLLPRPRLDMPTPAQSQRPPSMDQNTSIWGRSSEAAAAQSQGRGNIHGGQGRYV